MLNMTKSFITCNRCPRQLSPNESMLEVKLDCWGHGWIPPRGWAGTPELGHRPIVTVSLNPGHPLPSELEIYNRAGISPYLSKDDVTDEHADTILKFCLNEFENPPHDSNHIYHRKAIAYVRMAMWLLSYTDHGVPIDALNDDWKEYAWLTDAFKCSTANENGPSIPLKWGLTCVNSHLRRELEAIKPKLVISLGGGASTFLQKAGITHVKARHPSRGCPRAEDDRHIPCMIEMARMLGVAKPVGLVRSIEFLDFRRKLQELLFS